MAVPDIPELICGHLKLEMKLKEHGWIGLLESIEEKGLCGPRLRSTFQAKRSERCRCAIAPSRSSAWKGGSGEGNARSLVELMELSLDRRDEEQQNGLNDELEGGEAVAYEAAQK
jgi:hypothetical protein